MAATEIRLAIRDYVKPTAGLSKTYKDEPYFVTGEAWYDDNGNPGTVAYVHIDDEKEDRFVLTGSPQTGQEISYDVSIVVLYQYFITDTSEPDDWVDGLDALIAALKARIRADPKLGTGPNGIVTTAGQEKGALHIIRDLPKRKGGIVRSWNCLRFKVTEVLT